MLVFNIKGTFVFYLRVANHKLEVIVAVDASRYVLVVVLKLFNSHDVITLVSLPKRHEFAKDFVSGLVSRLEVRVEADIVSNTNIIDGDLATAILVEHAVGLMHHVSSAIVKIAADGAQKLIEGNLTVFVGIEMLHNLSHLDLTQLQAVVAHGVLEFNGG